MTGSEPEDGADDDEAGDGFPAEAEHYVVIVPAFQTGHSEAWNDDDRPPDRTRGEDAVFSRGDPVPRALARRYWEEYPFGWPPKALVALDEETRVVGGAGGATSEEDLDEEEKGALERFRNYHWGRVGDRR